MQAISLVILCERDSAQLYMLDFGGGVGDTTGA
jgi:hypothetical protein